MTEASAVACAVPTRENDRVGLYRDEAIVLRTQKLGEADRIITLLTRGTGRVRAVAKGVRRTTSRFGSRLEPFTHVDLQLAEGRRISPQGDDTRSRREEAARDRATEPAGAGDEYRSGHHLSLPPSSVR